MHNKVNYQLLQVEMFKELSLLPNSMNSDHMSDVSMNPCLILGYLWCFCVRGHFGGHLIIGTLVAKWPVIQTQESVEKSGVKFGMQWYL